jgi:hypothetical protein
MPRVVFVPGSTRTFVSARERAAADPALAARLAEYRAPLDGVTACVHHAGDANRPQLVENHFPPGGFVEAHAHDTDEIMVITEGDAQFGNRWLGPGSSVYIPAMTLYSFRAGDSGLTFLNFRPHAPRSGIIRKDELLAERPGENQ